MGSENFASGIATTELPSPPLEYSKAQNPSPSVQQVKKTSVSENLLPTSFINTDGKVIQQDVAVPCVVPANCQKCLKTGKLRLHPGSGKIAVVTKEGRFDLSYPEFKCSECEGVMIAAENDLISSGWWPGSPKNMSYLFSADLLIMWNHLVHKTPGTSERKFIETFCEISKRFGRSGTICRQTFAISNKYYQYMEYLVEVESKLRELFTCTACGRRPLAMHIDGIMKLFRWLSSKGVDCSQLLNDIGIVSDAVFQEHADKINQIKPKLGKVSKDTCGGASYKAGKSDSVNDRTGLAETGIVFCTCRHGYLLRGVDMAKGETYRHVHYLHDYALRSGCEFLCYDVVCQYWTFAEDLSKVNNEFKPHTETMKPFLSRWHGKTHAWYCQILYSGHWMKGAELTTGETTEQSNSKMARYGSSTKHMSRANRRDHLTQAMIYYNKEKEERMPKLLPKMLASAKANVIRYESDFNRLVMEREEKMLGAKKYRR
ncbi:uncharacterized protein LOC124322600 [Daphnia pulicaria]|uniref:uncharacterized protein LOC124322600 n=1 Tax=Daphnia pulicaria TaxID=35523 RepID=UPI001EE9D531|nr:uncharacterized protein LOC124322600 [Daphnia pulicaria]